MGGGTWTLGRSRLAKYQASSEFSVVPRARRSRNRELVAAVCYRVSDDEIDFLLVQTRGGRWTFPKGGVEPGMTRAQAAAMEALEEAGVYGRVEEVWFARYYRHKVSNEESGSPAKTAIHAHLCEVLRHGSPEESDRNPTWFSAEKAKRRLRADRKPENGNELARVVDRAVARVRRLQSGTNTMLEPLRKVRFEKASRVSLSMTDIPRF